LITTPSFTTDAGKITCSVAHHAIHPKNTPTLSHENTGFIFSGNVAREKRFLNAEEDDEKISTHP
jgi:hypothetical protein